jgi:hypothetical protein
MVLSPLEVVGSMYHDSRSCGYCSTLMLSYSNGGEGMIWNQPTPSITKPCSDCMILGMNAGLEYLDGADANTDTKMWLHHVRSARFHY